MRHLGCHLVGTYEQAQELEQQLDIESDDVKFLVIYGERGTGKTTLARAVFVQISDRFEGSSFLRDISEMSDRYGFEYLKQKLLTDISSDDEKLLADISSVDENPTLEKSLRKKKALIVLDNVAKWEQIEKLAGSSTWFGPGSRILITLSPQGERSELPISGLADVQAITLLLSQRAIDESELPKITEWCISNQPLLKKMKELNVDQALQLFSRYAFGQDSPLDSFDDLSKQIISHSQKLPLVLEIMGSLLRRERNMEKWRDVIQSLTICETIEKKLKLSYDALSSNSVKRAFLDIACFFVNEEKTKPTYMWSTDCPEEGLAELLMSSLVKIVDGDKLWMHHYLRDLGRAIVARISSPDRCRFWMYDEAEKVLKSEKDMKVEAICIYYQQKNTLELKAESFSNKRQLRFLRLHPMEFKGDFKDKLNSLRWISWHKGPKDFRATKFASTSLVILDLARSLIDDDWAGWQELEGKLSLRVIDLTCCQNLTRMPDFSEFTSLERLILEDCCNLERIGTSIGELKCLKCLNVKGCDSLMELPKEIGSLEALTEILISKKEPGPFSLPDEMGNLRSLTILEIVNVEMTSFPESIGGLEKLQRLSISKCSGFKELPGPEIGKLTSLVDLEISETQITSLPESIGHLRELKVIKMERSKLQGLPNAIWKVDRLEELHAKDNKHLKGTIPDGIEELKNLRILDLSGTKVERLPETVSKLSHLQKLRLPSSCKSPHWSKLPKSLTDLGIQYPPLPCQVNDMQPEDTNLSMPKLEKLELHVLDATNHQSTSCVSTPRLKSFSLSCQYRKTLQDLKCSSFLQTSLSKLILEGVKVYTASQDISNLENLSSLELRDCELFDGNDSRSSQPEERRQAILFDNKLDSLVHFSALSSHFRITSGLEICPPQRLRVLYFKKCDFSKSKLQLSGLNCLKQLKVSKCPGLTLVEGLGNVEQLEELNIRKCKDLAELRGDISNSKRLRVIRIFDNKQLTNIEGIEKVQSKDEHIVQIHKMVSDWSNTDNTDYRDDLEKTRKEETRRFLPSMFLSFSPSYLVLRK